jgi:hypothetical protein
MPKPTLTRLPHRLPPGSKYILESQERTNGCMMINRYVELPDGRRVDLAPRLVPIRPTEPRKSGSCTRQDAARH